MYHNPSGKLSGPNIHEKGPLMASIIAHAVADDGYAESPAHKGINVCEMTLKGLHDLRSTHRDFEAEIRDHRVAHGVFFDALTNEQPIGVVIELSMRYIKGMVVPYITASSHQEAAALARRRR